MRRKRKCESFEERKCLYRRRPKQTLLEYLDILTEPLTSRLKSSLVNLLALDCSSWIPTPTELTLLTFMALLAKRARTTWSGCRAYSKVICWMHEGGKTNESRCF